MREANDPGARDRVLGAVAAWAERVVTRRVQEAQTADAVLRVLSSQLRPDETRRLPGVEQWLRELRPDLFPEEAARESRQASDAEA